MNRYKITNDLLRPDIARRKLLLSLVHTVQIICTLLALLAVYGWMASRDATAEAENTAARAEKMLAHCLNGGTFRTNELGALKCGVTLHEPASLYMKD